MDKKVEILHEANIFHRLIFTVREATLRYSLFTGGMSEAVTHLSLERGDGVAVLMHDAVEETIVMVEQFRYSTHGHGEGWLLEIPAGILHEYEDPAAAVIREIDEETGYHVKSVQPIGRFFLNPADCSERIHLFYTAVKLDDRVAEGGGLIEEHEDLRVIICSRQEVMQKLASGMIHDAKTIIALQWLELNHP